MATIKLLQDCYMTESWTIRRSGERFERNVQPSIMICTALKALYYLKWFVLRWMIYTRLSDLYYVERLELRWVICAALNYLHIVELFVVQRWMICLSYVEWVLRWMICITLNDLYYVVWFFTSLQNFYHLKWLEQQRNLQHWKTCTTLND